MLLNGCLLEWYAVKKRNALKVKFHKYLFWNETDLVIHFTIFEARSLMLGE